MLSGQGGLILEIKCSCARKMWHEREVGVFWKWAYFCETMVIARSIGRGYSLKVGVAAKILQAYARSINQIEQSTSFVKS